MAPPAGAPGKPSAAADASHIQLVDEAPLLSSTLLKKEGGGCFVGFKPRHVNIFADHVDWYDGPDGKLLGTLLLLPTAECELVGAAQSSHAQLVVRSGNDNIVLKAPPRPKGKKNAADASDGEPTLASWRVRVTQQIEAMKREKDACRYDESQPLSIFRIQVPKPASKADSTIYTRFQQSGEPMFAVALRSKASLAELRRELQCDRKLPGAVEPFLRTYLSWGDLPKPILHYLGIARGSRFLQLGEPTSKPGGAPATVPGGGASASTGAGAATGAAGGAHYVGFGFVQMAPKKWQRLWIDLEMADGRLSWSRKATDKAALGAIVTGRECATVGGATPTSVHIVGRKAKGKNPMDASIVLDLEDAPTLEGFVERLQSCAAVQPLKGVPNYEKVLLCCQVRWNVDGQPPKTSWVSLSEFAAGADWNAGGKGSSEDAALSLLMIAAEQSKCLMLRAFGVLRDARKPDFEMIVDSSAELEQPPGSTTQLSVRARVASTAKTNVALSAISSSGGSAVRKLRVTLNFKQPVTLDVWRGCLQDAVGVAASIPWQSGALDMAFMEALARCRSGTRATDKLRSLYDRLVELPDQGACIAMISAITRRFFLLEGTFADMQAQGVDRVDSYLCAWAAFVDRLVPGGGAELGAETPALKAALSRVELLRIALLGCNMKPLQLQLSPPSGAPKAGNATGVLDVLEAWLKDAEGTASGLVSGTPLLDGEFVKGFLAYVGHPALPATLDQVGQWCAQKPPATASEMPALFARDAASALWEQSNTATGAAAAPAAATPTRATSARGSSASSAALGGGAAAAEALLASQLQLRMALHPTLLPVLNACAASSRLSGRRSASAFDSVLASLPRQALEPRFKVALAPLLEETLTLRGFTTTASLGFDARDECATVLRSLTRKNMLSGELLRTELLPRLWELPQLRPAVADLLTRALQTHSDESAHALTFCRAAYGFLLTQNHVTEKLADSDAARMTFALYERLLVSLGRVGLGGDGGDGGEGGDGGDVGDGGDGAAPRWIADELLPAIVASCRDADGTGNASGAVSGAVIFALFCRMRLPRLLELNCEAYAEAAKGLGEKLGEKVAEISKMAASVGEKVKDLAGNVAGGHGSGGGDDEMPEWLRSASVVLGGGGGGKSLSAPSAQQRAAAQALADASSSDAVRSPAGLDDLLCGLWRLLLAVSELPAAQSDLLGSFKAAAEKATSWFSVYFVPSAKPLRTRFARLLVEHANVDAEFGKRLGDGALMTHRDFYSWPALRLLSTSTMRQFSSPELYYDAAEQACRLRLFEDIDLATTAVLLEADRDRDKRALFHTMVKHVAQKPLDAFFEVENVASCLNLAQLLECATAGGDAMKIVATSTKARRDLSAHFEHILHKHSPGTWTRHFQDAATVAFFIKYIDREDLELAKHKFEAAVKQVDDPLVTQWWQEASALYTAPLVDAAKLDLSDTKAFQSIIDKAASHASKEMRLVAEITGRWMEFMISIGNPPMTPHHTQVLCMLLFARYYEWAASSKAHAAKVHAIVAQVATGEGKSMIIAMVAIYMAKLHGRKVHILENNEGLLDRDFEKNTPFFTAFALQANGASRPIKVANSIDPEADVCYCLTSQLEDLFLKGVRGSNLALDEVVLIVDEVDDLIVDDDPTRHYVTSDADFSTAYSQVSPSRPARCLPRARGAASAARSHARSHAGARRLRSQFCEVLKAGGRQPGGLAESDVKLWQKASAAKQAATAKKLNADYVSMGSEYAMLIDGKLPRVRLTDAWLEYLNYRDFGLVPSFQTKFCCVSKPHLFNSYVPTAAPRAPSSTALRNPLHESPPQRHSLPLPPHS